MRVAYKVLNEGVTLEMGKIPRRELRAGGSRASRGGSQPDLLAGRAAVGRIVSTVLT